MENASVEIVRFDSTHINLRGPMDDARAVLSDGKVGIVFGSPYDTYALWMTLADAAKVANLLKGAINAK